MGRLSSKSFIKLHALFLFSLAAYLTRVPEVITDSDLVSCVGDGMRIDTIRIFSRSRSPLACCGIILLTFALLDLILVIKLPTLNQVIALAQLIHYDLRHHPEVATMLTNINALVASIRFHMCVALIITRFWTFVVVSFRIYASAPGVWGLVDERVGSMWKTYGSSLVVDASSVDQLKNKVVLLYGAMETMFCFWILHSLQDERQEIEARLGPYRARISG